MKVPGTSLERYCTQVPRYSIKRYRVNKIGKIESRGKVLKLSEAKPDQALYSPGKKSAGHKIFSYNRVSTIQFF